MQPSALAARAARDLPWHGSLKAALAAAATSKRPVLWYVPTVPRSPMDRKPVVDLYLRAGPLSDPDLRPLLARFELVQAVPTRKLAARYQLKPFRFIEPGFLVLDASGKELRRQDRISTMSPAWFARNLDPEHKAPSPEPPSETGRLEGWMREQRLFGDPDVARRHTPEGDGARGGELTAQVALLLFGAGRYDEAARVLAAAASASPRLRFLAAVAAFRSGKHATARKAWRALAQERDYPGAARAAAEAEGFGPIARGFYTFRDLPAGWSSQGPGTRCARKVADLPMLRQRSVEFLLAMQNDTGGFEDSNYDFGGLDSLPNVYVAVTALCCEALLAHRDVDPSGCDAAIEAGLHYILDPKNLAPSDKDEWIFARAYPMHLLVALLDAHVEFAGLNRERLQTELRTMAAEVFARQQSDGAFRHEYSNPFVTATVLIALHAAQRYGVVVPETSAQRALAALVRCRSEQGAFSYSQVRGKRRTQTRIAAAAGRMPLCEAALECWGHSDAKRVAAAVKASFDYQADLERSRKYDDHAGPLHIGGFFFWYDMLGRKFALQRLGAAGTPGRRRLRELVCSIAEIDGCFVDSHELGRTYGTAMALLCLAD